MLVYGNDGHGLTGGRNLRAGGGFAVPLASVSGRNWNLFIIASFLFERPGIDEAARKHAIAANPQNTALQNATAGRARFFRTTLDPTFRFFTRRPFNMYRFAGFGSFRRTIEFTAASTQGTLLQPGSPIVFGQDGDSG